MTPSDPGRFVLRTLGPEPAGATPLEAEDLEGLIPDFVATRANLNLVEFENIVRALPWAEREAGRRGALGTLDVGFLFALHRHMFSDVWRWAGTQRRRETNIGVTPHAIPEGVRSALDDARYWHEHDTFPLDERGPPGFTSGSSPSTRSPTAMAAPPGCSQTSTSRPPAGSRSAPNPAASFGAGTGPTDEAISSDGQYLYAGLGRTRQVAIERINADGSLTTLGIVSGMPEGMAGLAVN